MALPEPREGEALGFTKHGNPPSDVTTLGDPEKLIWSSIGHMTVFEVANDVLENVHQVKSRRSRERIAFNLRLYIQQAFEFYEAAKIAKANTVPLFYYYSFLNLAKALCEIAHPRFHEMPACYLHGISWKPNRDYLVNMQTESVNVARRGVWHVLWEMIEREPCQIANPMPLRIKDLFSLCPETEDEYEKTYQEPAKLVRLIDPNMLFDEAKAQVWIQFSVERDELRNLNMSRKRLLSMITHNGSEYQQVRGEKDLWRFEFKKPKNLNARYQGTYFGLVEPEMKAMNLFTSLGGEDLDYALPIQSRIPMRLSQILVLYSLTFWLGSLVRYDPHSVMELQKSEYWILIDGFMNQSRIWLLELFEWEMYKKEMDLRRLR